MIPETISIVSGDTKLVSSSSPPVFAITGCDNKNCVAFRNNKTPQVLGDETNYIMPGQYHPISGAPGQYLPYIGFEDGHRHNDLIPEGEIYGYYTNILCHYFLCKSLWSLFMV